jgi:hypothetical protein
MEFEPQLHLEPEMHSHRLSPLLCLERSMTLHTYSRHMYSLDDRKKWARLVVVCDDSIDKVG